MTVQDIFALVDKAAPFDDQAEFDNAGFLVGQAGQEVSCILLALDVTEPVIDEAVSLGAQLIITHHPLMFVPRKSLTDEDYEGRLLCQLVRNGISLIAAHTNLDKAPGGINDVLAERCGLLEITGEGFLRFGSLPAPVTASSYASELSHRLGDAVRLMGPADAVLRRVALCSGGGSNEWPAAAAAGCDAFISGEIKHHHALAMADRGIVALECGHYATEAPGIAALGAALQKLFDTLKCKIRIYVSGIPAYSFSRHP